MTTLWFNPWVNGPVYLNSLSTTSFLRGVFSLKTLFLEALNKPLVNVSNASTGGVTQDFSGNYTGTTLVSTSNGIPLSLWLTINGSSTAYVRTWYDQGQYVNGGTAYNATAVVRPIINTTTTPWTIDGTAGGYFTLPSGTIVGNGTYTFSAKTDVINGAAGIMGAGNNTNNQSNGFRFWSNQGYDNFWWNNDVYWINQFTLSSPVVGTIINYVNGSSTPSYSTGGTSSTVYTSLQYINGSSAYVSNLTTNGNPSTTSYTTRTGWAFVPGNDRLLACGGSSLSNQFNGKVYWAIHSSQAISNSDRLIIEGIT